jgi:hypothetical protein
MKWLTDDISEWYQEVMYQQEFHAAMLYHQQANRFLEAWSFYKYHLSRFSAMKKPDKTGDELSMLKAGVQSRGR